MANVLRTVSRTHRKVDVETDKRARRVIAQGALTNSKRPESFVKGVYPTHLHSAEGVTAKDTVGNTYIDFICGLGTNLIGHGNPAIVEACISALRSGINLSLSSLDEVVLGEKIAEIMPFVEAIKILKTGSEGCTAALRIARAATGRTLVLSEGYHGWHDEFVSLTQPALGVVGDYPITSAIDFITEDTAAIIVEPVITDFSNDRIEWLKALRAKCTKHKVVLIFDETITAFRFPKFCVANWCGVAPDLIVFGKALAGGMPMSVVGGRRDLMNCGEYFVSSSFAGDRVSIAGALATIKLLQTKFEIDTLWASGKAFIERFNGMDLGAKIVGYPTRGVLAGENRALFMQEACKAGLLFGASWFYAFPHMEKEHMVFSTLKDVALKLQIGNIKLEGDEPQSPFASKVREMRT